MNDLNNEGLAVGLSVAGRGFDAEARPVLWDAEGQATALENGNYPSSGQKVRAINDKGNMVGVLNGRGNVVWLDLVPMGLEYAVQANDINNADQVAGNSYGAGGSGTRATIWNDLQASLLGGEPAGWIFPRFLLLAGHMV